MVYSFNDMQAKIRESILKRVPKEAEITRIEFEGPRLAIYTKKPEVLIEQGHIISEIVSLIRKRIVVRSDPSVRTPEAEAEKIIRNIIPQEAEIDNITFDLTLGEAVIEAKKPGLVIGKNGSALREIIKATRWRSRVLRTPPIPSKIIAHIRHYLQSEAKSRERFLRSVGERVFRPQTFREGSIRFTALGGFQQVGRSCMLVQTGESAVMIDCGINPGSNKPIEAYPRIDLGEFDWSSLDAVVISHAHLDHCGFVPFLYKYGYTGPVYCSEPTLSLMTLLQLDYLDICSKEGVFPPYDQKDIRQAVLHSIPLGYGVVTDIAPDMRLTLHNAGHILGSSIVHLHIGEGLHNVVYTGDYKFGKTMLLEPAVSSFPRVETLITESTYGSPEDVVPSRNETEQRFVHIVNKTLEAGGKVLVPVLAVGRAQEIMMVIDSYMKQGLMTEAPVFIEGMISEVIAIHTAYPEYLSRDLRDAFLHQGINPFQSDYFTIVKDHNSRKEIIEGDPCIILATSGMLEGGPVIEYFKQLAPDDKNQLIFVSYQIEGTLGRRVQRGLNETPSMNSEGKIEVIKINMKRETVEGFTGHSGRNQIVNYIKRLSSYPERIIVCHGEKKKCIGMASTLRKLYRVNSYSPDNLESVRLK